MPADQTAADLPEHGGGIARAAERFGGQPGQWLDLSTGINPQSYPIGLGDPRAWKSLPDRDAEAALAAAARAFWGVPESAEVLAGPGASALIARLPALAEPGVVDIPGPTYGEHAAAFAAQGWDVIHDGAAKADARVLVHPNNPDGRTWRAASLDGVRLRIVDESFCDTLQGQSLVGLTARPGHIVLKSFGKFWGLGGLRLGFAIGDPALLARLRRLLGPWPVSGPALAVGTRALKDTGWAEATRARLAEDAGRLDRLLRAAGAEVEGGTTLFRLYRVDNAEALHVRLAQRHILTRIFPYSTTWIRIGVPGNEADWRRLEVAL